MRILEVAITLTRVLGEMYTKVSEQSDNKVSNTTITTNQNKDEKQIDANRLEFKKILQKEIEQDYNHHEFCSS